MRKFFILTCLLFSLLLQAQVKKVTAETDVQGITIFSSGAQVARTASVALTPGRTEITFTGFSNQLEQQGVQLKADASITLLSVQTTKDYLSARKTDAEERNLRERIATVKDRLAADEKSLEVYKNEEAMLLKNQDINSSTGVKAADLKELLDLHRQRLTEVYNRQLEIKKRIVVQQQEWAATQAQLNSISKKKESINYTVTAVVESKENRTVKFGIQYTVKDAGWYPTYDVRVTDVTQPLNVLMNANIFQRSGETWKNVAITLSTGNPTDNATPSLLQPWMLGFYDPTVRVIPSGAVMQGTAAGRITNERGEPVPFANINVKGSQVSATTDANGFFKIPITPPYSTISIAAVGYETKNLAVKSQYYNIQLKEGDTQLQEVVVVGYSTTQNADAPEAQALSSRKQMKKEEIQTVAVTTQYQPTAIIYNIDDTYTLETDGKLTTIGIKKFTLPALYQYYTAPKIDASVFLTAKVVNWQEYDLQSGEASLYFEGTYLGKSYIDLGAAGDTLSLSLGKDNGIKVTRKLVKEYSTQKFIGSNKTEKKEYQITLNNTKKAAVNVIVQDNFPVSVNKEIDVDNVKATEANLDKDTGIATWNVTLQPAQEKKLQISYNVKYPKDKKVILE